MVNDEEVTKYRPRLSEDVRDTPWVQAANLNDCFLYWMPTGSFPLRSREREWISEFHTRFTLRLETEFKLRTELFLQYKHLENELQSTFLRYSQKCIVLAGLGRKPGATIPTLPTSEDLRKIIDDKKQFDLKNWVADYTFWFVQKQQARQRQLFLGYGGMTCIWLAPDPKTKAPRLPFNQALRDSHPAFKSFDVDGQYAASFSLADAFLAKSKKLFGVGLENEVQYDGITFVLPLLESGHFFTVTPEERAQWFELFDVYWNESEQDKGIVLAFRKDFRDAFHDVLASMAAEGLTYVHST